MRTIPWYIKSACYLALAIIGLYLTWSMNLQAFAEGRDYFGDWVNSGPAVTSLLYDIVVVALAGTIFMILESWRIKSWWLALCIPFTALAIAFSLPLFLGLREFVLRERPDN